MATRKLYVDSSVLLSGSGGSWNTAYSTLSGICASLSGNREPTEVYSRGQFQENLKLTNAFNVVWVGDTDLSNPTIIWGTMTSNNWTDLGGNVFSLTGVTYPPSCVVYDYKQDSITGASSGISLPAERAIDGKGVFYGHLKWVDHGTTPSAGQWSYTPSSTTVKISPFFTPVNGLTSVKALTRFGRGYTGGAASDPTDTSLNGIEAYQCNGATFSGIRSYLWSCPSPPNKQIGHGAHGTDCTGCAFDNMIIVDCGYRAAAFSGNFTLNNTLSNIKVYGGTLTGASAPASTPLELSYFVFYSADNTSSVTSGSRGYNLCVDEYPWILGNGRPIHATGYSYNILFNYSHSSSTTGANVPGGGSVMLGDIKFYGSQYYSHEKEIGNRWFAGTTAMESYVAISNAANVPAFSSTNPYAYPVQHYYGYYDAPTFSAPQTTKQVFTSFFNSKFTSYDYDTYRYSSRNTDLFSMATTGNAYFTNCVVDFNVYTDVVVGTKGFFKIVGGCNLYLDSSTFHSSSTGATQTQVSYIISAGNLAGNFVQGRGNIFTKAGPNTTPNNAFTRDFNEANNTSHKFGWNIFWHKGVSSGIATFNGNTSPFTATAFHAAYGISGATNAMYINPGVDVTTRNFIPSITGYAYTNRNTFSLTSASGAGRTSFDGYPYNNMPGAYGLSGTTADITSNNSWNYYVTENSKPAWLSPDVKARCIATDRGWEIPLLGQPEGSTELIAAVPGLVSMLLNGFKVESPDISIKSLTSTNAGLYYQCQIDVTDIRGRATEFGSVRLSGSLPSWLKFDVPLRRKLENPARLIETGSYYAILGGTASATGNFVVSLTASNYFASQGLTFNIMVS